MPRWLQVVSSVNPLTYEVDGLRALMLSGGTTAYGLMTDALILAATAAVLVAIAARLYPRLTS
jgi:ABC-2 type transport system permease protein